MRRHKTAPVSVGRARDVTRARRPLPVLGQRRLAAGPGNGRVGWLCPCVFSLNTRD